MLALGIGATTAMFTVVDSVLLRALPYANPAELVEIWETFPHWHGRPVLDAQWNRIPLSYAEYRRVGGLTDVLESVGAASWQSEVSLTGLGDPLTVSVAHGSASLLPLLGLRPALGRWFLPGEDGPGARQIAVIPDALWRGRYGAAPILGQPIRLDDRPFTIVGVLPAGFQFGSVSIFGQGADAAAVWTPLGAWPDDLAENSQRYEVLARLRPGTTSVAVRAAIAAAIRADRAPAQHDARLVSRREAEDGAIQAPLLELFAAVAVLLLITCGNLAALLLGEAPAREREIRTRLAIGAQPARMVRQLVTEAVLLSAGGTALGVALAAALARSLLSRAPVTLPRADTVAFNGRSAAFAVGITVAVAVAMGIAPALSLARTSLRVTAGSRTVSDRRRLQHGLLAVQVALSSALLVVAGLLVRTLATERAMPLGFTASHLLTVSLNLNRSPSADAPALDALLQRLLARLAALPGVEAITTTSNPPIAGPGGQWAINPDPTGQLTLGSPTAQHDEVWPNFFQVVQIPILDGRPLAETDRPGGPLVAVINETLARDFWPHEAAVGKSFLAPNGGKRLVVGVAADIRERGAAQWPCLRSMRVPDSIRRRHRRCCSGR